MSLDSRVNEFTGLYDLLVSIQLLKGLEEMNQFFNTEASAPDASRAKASVTFWGTRIVSVGAGSISLEKFAVYIQRLASQRKESDNLTPAERIAGIEIVKKLQKFYKETDAQLSNSNFFTRFIAWIREFTIIPYTPRFFIEHSVQSDFCSFGKEKFIQTFGRSALRGHSDLKNGTVEYRVIVDEQKIRELSSWLRIPSFLKVL